MMRLIRLITLRSIRTRRLRTLLSTFGIVLGVAGMFAISATNQTAFQTITRMFENTSGRVTFEVHSVDNSASFPQTVLQLAASIPGVQAAAPVVKVQAMLDEEGSSGEIGLSFFGASSENLILHGVDPQQESKIRDYKITAGRFLSGDPDRYEVVLVEDYAADNKIEVGRQLAIRTAAGPARIRVVGLMAKEGPGQQNQGNFGVINLGAAQKLNLRPNEIDQIDILANVSSTDPEALERLRLEIQAHLKTKYTVVYPASQGQRMAQMLSGYQIGLNFTGGIALFVGAFLIYNAFSMTVVERTREFGLLRAIGLTRRQIFIQVLAEGLLLGAFGALAGALLGLLMARGLVQLMSQILGQPLDPGAVPVDLLTSSMAIGLAVTLLAAILPAAQAGKISPLEALRMASQARDGWLLRSGWWVGLLMLLVSAAVLIRNPFPYDVQYRIGSMVVFTLFLGAMLLIPASTHLWERIARKPFQWIYGNGGQLGARNLERARLRTMLTAAALLVGVSMIVIIQGMTASYSIDLKDWMNAYIGGDLFVNSSVPMKRDLQTRIEALPTVFAAAPIRYFEVIWKQANGTEEKINFMAVDPKAHTRVTHFVFSDPQTDSTQAVDQLNQGGALFISSVMSEKYGIKQGDTLWLQTRSGLKPFRAAAVVMDFYNQGMVVTGSWADMRRYFRINDANLILVKVNSGFSIDQAREQIDTLYGTRYRLSMESNQAVKQRALSLMNQAFSMFDVLGIIAVVVAALGVVNTLTMSVIERTREIGMLRSIGMTRWQVVNMVLAEAGLLGVIGGLLGLVFGVLLTRIFLESMSAMSGYSLNLVIPLRTIFTALIVALIVSQLAAALPAMRASRTPVLEAIHYE